MQDFMTDLGSYGPLVISAAKAVKEAFDAGGISIPHPHQVNVEKAG